MIFLTHGWSALLDLITVARRSERDKDIEILLLRQHLRILQRKHLKGAETASEAEIATAQRRPTEAALALGDLRDGTLPAASPA